MTNTSKYFRIVLLTTLLNWVIVGCASDSSNDGHETKQEDSIAESENQLPNSNIEQKNLSTSQQTTTVRLPTVESPSESVANSINPFALDLYKQLSKEKGNIFLSPYSISSALELVYQGAKKETQAQMAKVLHFNQNIRGQFANFENVLGIKDRNEFYQFYLANTLWLQKDFPVQLDFTYFLQDNYNNLKIQQQDFAHDPEKVRKTINDFVTKETSNKIKEILAPNTISEQTKLILTNAIYFRGTWKAPFDKAQTQEDVFHLSAKEQVKVPMMFQKYEVNYFEDELVQLIELPYKGRSETQDDLSMVILLPKNDKKLSDIEQKLATWLSFKQFEKQLVAIHLPKFMMESNVKLMDTLKSLGMKAEFDQQLADFSGIGEKLFISTVAHKAFVEVNEEGTEAAASTAVVVTSRGVAPPVKYDFNANRPFIFWIKDNYYGTILFMGRVANPVL